MPKKGRTFGIESARKKVDRDALAVCAQCFRVAQTGERMIISNEIKRLTLGLERDGRLHHPEVIADVQRAAGLDAGKNSHGFVVCHSEQSRRISVLFGTSHHFSADSKRFLDFARNDKSMFRAPLGWMPDKIRMRLTK